MLAAGAKVGAYVEVKKSTIGAGAKVPHLSYIGDATIGAGVNIGAGSITANYDGVHKYETVIGDGAFIGTNTTLIAPVTVAAGGFTAAGSAITDDVAAGDLAVARGRQSAIPGWVRPPAARQHHGGRRRRLDFPPSGRAVGRVRRDPGTAGTAHHRTGEGVARVNHISITTRKSLMLFSGRGFPDLADEIAKYLEVDVTPQTIYDFANEEIFVRSEESVRGSDVFVIQSCGSPLNKSIMETLLMIDALKRASAKRITVVLPFYPYARQDKKHRGREPISARLIADLLKTAGAHRLMAVDLHTDQIQGFFDGPVDHLMALPLLTDYVGGQVRRRRPRRGLPRLRPGPHRGEVGPAARRPPGGLHPQDPGPEQAQPGGRRPRGR